MDENRTTSFYGNAGVSPAEVDQKIEENNEHIEELIDAHVVVSKTQPTAQQQGDIWLVVKDN